MSNVGETPKIFLTGATGYIGGDFLVAVTRAHPDWEVTCLIRDARKISQVQKILPNLRIVEGTLDSTVLIEAEARRADITVHTANCDHVPSAKAIARGLTNRTSQKPAYWIHTSGAGILTFNNFAQDSYGHALDTDEKVYDDWDNVHELTSLLPRALHRHVDRIVLAASEPDPPNIKTAIVCPPCIYGSGRGPGNQRSVQIYVATEVMLRDDKAVMVGTGKNIWHGVHVQDLSKLYLSLVEAAVLEPSKATWNSEGYYLADHGEFVWGHLIQEIANEAHRQGHITSSKVHSVDKKEALALHPWLPYLTGTTSRGKSKRAQKLFGWTPSKQDVYSEIPEIVKSEALRLKSSSSKL